MLRIRISEAEAARDFAAVMTRVREGAEVIIENGTLAVAVIRTSVPPGRSISECIGLARQHEVETGEAPVLDTDFAIRRGGDNPKSQALEPSRMGMTQWA
jgi:antitoxin (DNA-binding transcriptional repressor) of toxin-antitoxin stability system